MRTILVVNLTNKSKEINRYSNYHTTNLTTTLSTFRQLSRLCEKEPGIKRIVNEFKLIGIIINDPNDDEFRRHIKYSLEDLHEVICKDFAIVDKKKTYSQSLNILFHISL